MSSDEMQISEAELRAMTAEMVEMHHATFPQMRENLSDLGSALRDEARVTEHGASRRRLLIGGGGLIAGTVLMAASGGRAAAATLGDVNPGRLSGPGSSVPGSSVPTPSLMVPPSARAEGGGDAAALKLNASLENLAVFAYGAALAAAGKGKFGKVPPAVAEFATHAKQQHSDHADAFNAALKNAGGTAYTDPDPALTPTVKKLFAKVNSVPKLAMLALTLENTAAATYIQQMGTLTSAEALSAVATIAPVERQHAAILSFVLGDYPVPDTFVKLGATSTSLGARPTSDVK